MENNQEKELVPFVILARYYNTTLTNKYKARKFWHNPIPGEIKANLPGTIEKIFVSEGQTVNKGEVLLIHEAMKMKNRVLAPESGIIKEICVAEGDKIKKDTPMVIIE